MKFLLGLFCFFGLVVPSFAIEPIIKVSNPAEVVAQIKDPSGLPKELEGLRWNRWSSKNFIVCSLDDRQAEYLHKHLELVKGWCLSRWGMMDIDFSVECKMIVVHDRGLHKKLFNLETTRVEIRRDEAGRIKETVIFLLAEQNPSQTVPVPLTEVCLAEFSQRYNMRIPLWAYKGMAQLNASLSQIRERIADIKPMLDRNDPLYFSKGLMEMDRAAITLTPLTKQLSQYNELASDKKRLYDNCAMLYCLMLRKEFGQDHFLKVVKGSTTDLPEKILTNVLHFTDYNHFDRSFKRYMIDITRDVLSGRTPDSYLQIREN